MLLGKNYDNAFSFSKVIRQKTVVSFLEAVHDNIIFDDVTITLPLHSDVENRFSIFLVK